MRNAIGFPAYIYPFGLMLLASCAGSPALQTTKATANQEGFAYNIPVPQIEIQLVDIASKDDRDKGISSLAVRVAPLESAADPNFTLMLRPRPNAMSADKFKFDNDANGFLSQVTFENDDKALDIAKEAAAIVATAFESAPLDTGQEAIVDRAVVNPFDSSKLQEAIANLNDSAKSYLRNMRAGSSFVISRPTAIVASMASVPQKCPADTTLAPDEIYYPLMDQIELKLTAEARSQGAQKSYLARTTFSAPNPCHLGHIKLSRYNFVHATSSISFDKGIPKSFTLDKPSEGLAVATFPIALVERILQAPTVLWKAKTSRDNERLAYLQAKADYEQKLAALKKDKLSMESAPLNGAKGFLLYLGEPTAPKLPGVAAAIVGGDGTITPPAPPVAGQ